MQRNLIASLEECCERPLTEKERQLVCILELVQIENLVASSPPQRFGRKRHNRRALARAFVAKAVYNHPHTRATIEALRATPVFRRLCGFVRRCDIPSESVFSRAFAEFAEMRLGEQVHEAMVEKFVKPGLVGHISRDATAIEGREKPVAKLRPLKPAPRKRGRP
ncbi:MAG TPA: transposase, partial [Desulfobaccales bacterium]|nr:transposase [Desulfobaccales bacterium]